MASRHPQQPRKPSRPYVQTNVQNTRYSYQETPVEMQRPVFQPFSSPTNSVIDESPLTPGSSRQPPGYDHTLRNPTPLPEEKALEANLSAPPSRMHPAYSAPIADHAPSPHPANSPPTSYAQSSNTAGPLPVKQHGSSTPLTTSTATTDPHKFGIDRADSYNPHALQGPNVGPSNHRPGQVLHPNAVQDPHWKHGLCEPDTLCCMGFFCPCLLYGKTMYRLSRRAEKKDATDLLGYERCNGSCGLFAIACGVQGVLRSICSLVTYWTILIP